MNFDLYKRQLKPYFKLKGYDVSNDLICCPFHEEDTPSCKIDDESFHCFGCGIHGDIYDAVEKLEGITDHNEQFRFVEKLFGGRYTPSPAPGPNKKEKEKFKSDPDAQKQLENYLAKNPAAENEIIKFLNLRAAATTLGVIRLYPADLIPAMVKNFFYWPGLDQVRRDLGADLLRRVGIPLKNPKSGISWWDHSGVMLKLPRGYYKLHYYVDGDCKKYNIKAPYPMPDNIDKTKPLIFVEGEMDAFASAAIGIPNIFASGSKNGLTGPKIKKYLLDVPEIILCFDADDPGRKASGLMPFEATDDRKTNIPEIMRNTGYTGKIKIAELPLTEDERDPEALIIAGKRGIVIKAIQEAVEYTPPEKKVNAQTPLKWDLLSTMRVQAILKKIKRATIEDKEPGDIQLFISAVLKASQYPDIIEKDLISWGATDEEIKNENDITPYILLEFAWKYGLSKYLQRTLKLELTPANELLKRINRHKPIVDIDFEEIKTNKNVIQFLETFGVRTAALVVSDILDGRIVYVESEKKHYFFNGHTWRREPDMTGVIYNIIIAIMVYFYEKIDLKELGLRKSDIDEIIVKMESRHFRMEIMKEFSQLEQFDIFKTSVLFDGPAVRETLTLIDGVLDFSGKKLIYRKSEKEEYRREILPYTIEGIKNALEPINFKKFMKKNFKEEATYESLMFYLSLIISRNTGYKYGGIFIGDTNTGKTSTLDILKAVLPNMIQSIPSAILVSKGNRQTSGNEATPYISALEGKGCGLASETGRNLHLNSELWKLLTGNDKIPSRNLFEQAREFVPTAQIIILTNNLPVFDGHDNATIQRMLLIPFLEQHKRDDKELIDIDEFKKKLTPEFPGIIKLFIDYYIKLKQEYRGAIPLSDQCKKYKRLYIDELDTNIDRFVKDCIKFEVADDAFIKVKDVYEHYLKYYNYTSDDSGKDALTRNKFTIYFKRDYKIVGYKQKKIRGEVDQYFLNVRIKPISEIPEEEITEEPPSPAKKPPAPMPGDNPF